MRRTKRRSVSTTALRMISSLPPAIWQSATNAICPIQNVEEAAFKGFDSLEKYQALERGAAAVTDRGKLTFLRKVCDYAWLGGMRLQHDHSNGRSSVCPRGREIVANVVKYHQQKFRYNEVEVSAKPSKDSRSVSTENLSIVIARLTAILRCQLHGPGPYRKVKKGLPSECKRRTAADPDGLSGGCNAGVRIHRGQGRFLRRFFGIRPVLRQKGGCRTWQRLMKIPETTENYVKS